MVPGAVIRSASVDITGAAMLTPPLATTLTSEQLFAIAPLHHGRDDLIGDLQVVVDHADVGAGSELVRHQVR